VDYLPRNIEEELDRWMMRDEALLIRGPRQSGKTTLLLHFKEKYNGNYVTLEEEGLLRTFEEAPRDFAARFMRENGRSILLLDEVQYSKKVGKNLKLLYDLFSRSLKLVATGSGSFDVKAQVGKFLVGRAKYFELMPLSFEEFLLWKAKDLHKIFRVWKNSVRNFLVGDGKLDPSPAFQREFSSLLEEYIIYGGFPRIVKEEDRSVKVELLKNLARTYLEKDVFFFFNVREMEKFRALLTYLSLGIGSLVELSSLMRELHMDYKTLEKYLSVLVNTYVIALVGPFYRSGVTELKKAKKAYYFDTGLRNGLLDNFLELSRRTDRGVLLENFVLNELREMGFSIKYWRTTGKAEVDFVIQDNEIIRPIEVKTTGRVQRGLSNFISLYKPKSALVFTQGELKISEIGKTKVAYIPHYLI
jgi:predicted AAA+ superfamily ATPase